jgi:predicted dehydrogenase
MLDVNWLTPAKRRQLLVVGEEGMFELDYLTQQLTFTRATDTTNPRLIGGYAPTFEGELVTLPVEAAEPLAAEVEAFLRVVIDGTDPIVDAEDGLWAVAIADALLVSAAEARAVDLGHLNARLEAR